MPKSRFTRWWRVLWASLLYFGYRGAAAVLVSYPLAAALAAPVSRYRAGDSLLFEPGGLLLVDALTKSGLVLRSLAGPTMAVAALASLGSLLPVWWLMRALCRGTRANASAGRELAGFALLGGGYWLFRALWVLLVGSVALSLGGLARGASDERMPVLCMALAWAGGALLGLVAATLHDLARAELVRGDGGGIEALGAAWASLFRQRRACIRLLLWHGGLWLAAALTTLAVVALGRLPEAPSAWWGHPAALQLAAATAVAARVAWLAVISRHAQSTSEAQADALL